MKKSTISIALASALLTVTVAQASEFDGGYVGVQAGSNKSSANTAAAPMLPAASGSAYGVSAGYNWDLEGVVLGVDGFYDVDASTTHTLTSSNFGSKVYGLDAKIGLAYGDWLPFAKLGYGHTAATDDLSTASGNGLHTGVGVEYKFAPQWSAQVDYTLANGYPKPGKIANKTAAIGINYYFETPAAAPVVAAVVAPVVVKAPEPVVAPAPVVEAPVVVAPPAPVVVAPAPKTIFTDKPMTIEGASFDTSSAKLKPTAFKQLNEVVAFAAKYPEANLSVDGYTDSRGKEKSNLILSTRRAESVKAYLVKKGVDAKRISTAGHGSAKTVADNTTDAGRAKNRRVEINSVIRVAQ